MKLLLLGASATEPGGEPWPIRLPGGEVVSSAKVGDYLDEEFRHYWGVYLNCANHGLPNGGGWLHEPPWVVQLVNRFGSEIERVRNWNLRKHRD